MDDAATRLWRGALGRQVLTYGTEHALRIGLSAIVGIVVARLLGPANLGVLGFAFAAVTLLAPVGQLGLPPLLVTRLARGDDPPAAYVAAFTASTAVTIVAGITSLVTVGVLRGFDTQVFGVTAATAGATIAFASVAPRAFLEVAGASRAVVIASSVAVTVGGLGRVLAAAVGLDLWIVAAAFSVDGATLYVLLMVSARRHGAPRIRHVRRRVRSSLPGLLRTSWPLMVAAVSVQAYMQIDQVMLGILAGDRPTGLYAATVRLSESGYFLAVAAMTAMRPRLARSFLDLPTGAYDRLTFTVVRDLVRVGVVLVFAVQVLAVPMVDILYGAQYADVVPLLRLHALAAPFVFAGVAGSQWLVDRGLERHTMRRALLGAIANVGLNTMLIPRLGAAGAAIATVVSYALASVLLNGFSPATRPLFAMQVRALSLTRGRGHPGPESGGMGPDQP